jgi:hypothetical protein
MSEVTTTRRGANFTTHGTQIIAPDGTPFVPTGINIYADKLCERCSTICATFPRINFIRVNVYGFRKWTPDTLRPFITDLTRQGVVVELEFHEYPQVLSGQELADLANWYATMAATFKDNAYVWFGTPNEPDPGAGDMISEEIHAIYDAIRGAGNDTVIMICPSGWFSPQGLVASSFAGMKNVAWDLHFYAWMGGGATDTTAMQGALSTYVSQLQTFGRWPVIIGEFSPAVGGLNPDGSGIDVGGWPAVYAVQLSGLGASAWAWTSGNWNSPMLLNSPVGDPSQGLHPWGQNIHYFITWRTAR